MQYMDLPCSDIWYADNPVKVLNECLSLLVIRVRNKNKLGLMINAGVLMTSSRKLSSVDP